MATAKRSEQSGTQSEKKPTCFVIMPISDAVGYDSGHFGRVYEHLLKPAIIAAGYEPIRADDTVKTDYIVVGIIRKIVESEMVVCDISARNPNVMYELGIRHAFNKPVVLVKDKATEKMFDIQGLRYTEYDEILRIDTVTKDIVKITNSVTETASTPEKDTNSIVHLAGIKPAEVPATQTISADTQIILSAINDLDRRVNEVQKASRVEVPEKKYFVRKLIDSPYKVGDKLYKDGEYYGTITEVVGSHVVVSGEAGARYLFDSKTEAFQSLKIEK